MWAKKRNVNFCYKSSTLAWKNHKWKLNEISWGEANWFEVAQDRPCGALSDDGNGFFLAELSSGRTMIYI